MAALWSLIMARVGEHEDQQEWPVVIVENPDEANRRLSELDKYVKAFGDRRKKWVERMQALGDDGDWTTGEPKFRPNRDRAAWDRVSSGAIPDYRIVLVPVVR